MRRICYFDSVRNTIAPRMRHPISASHELPQDIGPESITHTAMTAGQPSTTRYSIGNIGCPFLGQFAHCPYWYNQIKAVQLFRVIKAVQCVEDLSGIAMPLQHLRDLRSDKTRFMSVPAAPSYQCFQNVILLNNHKMLNSALWRSLDQQALSLFGCQRLGPFAGSYHFNPLLDLHSFQDRARQGGHSARRQTCCRQGPSMAR